MRDCGATKNARCRFGYRYTVYHTENSNHPDQNIDIVWHKRRMISTIILRNIIFLKKERNYHETIYNGAIGVKNFLG